MRYPIDRNIRTAQHESLMRVWGHLQHELLFVCWALADAALLTPFVLGVMGWARYWEPATVLVWLVMLMLFAFNLTRLLSAMRLPPKSQQTVTALSLFLVIAITLPIFFHANSPIFLFSWVGDIMTAINEPGNNLWLRDVIVFAIVILAWVRGLQLGRREYTVQRAGLRLRVGGLILAPMVVWLANTRLLWDSTPYILLFFLAGLTALSLIRAKEIEQNQRGEEIALHPRWLTAVFLASLLTIFTAGAAALIVSGESAHDLIGWLAIVWTSLRLTGTVAMTTFFYLLVPVLNLVDWFISRIGWVLSLIAPWLAEQWAYLGKIVGKFFIERRVSLPPEGQSGLPSPPSFDEVGQLTIQVSRNGQIIIVLLAVAVILLVALLVTRLYQETALATRTSSQLTDPKRRDGREAPLLQQLLGRLGLWRNWRTAASIRQIYRKMLVAAEASGYPRLEAETPYEYLKTLTLAWPDHQAETQLITSAFVRVRYGELPENKQEIQAIKSAWNALEQSPPTEQNDG